MDGTSVRLFYFLIIGCSALSLSAHYVDYVGSPNVQVMKIKPGLTLTAGQVENCGKVPFNISWSPQVLSPSGSVTIHAIYTVPYDFDGGFVNASFYFKGDTEPFIGYANDFECQQISNYVPCPVKAKLSFNKSFTINKLEKIGAYPGDYVARVEVNNKQGKQMICAVAHLTIGQ